MANKQPEINNNSENETAKQILGAGRDYISLTSGASMRPMLRQHKDVTVVAPVNRPLKKGDVVLYPGNNGSFILHRIMRISGDTLIIRGDNNYFTERVKRETVIGILKEFYRDGKYINCNDNFKYRMYTFYICHSYCLRYVWKKCIRPPLSKVKNRIFPKKIEK